MKNIFQLIAIVFLIALYSCSQQAEDENHNHDEKELGRGDEHGGEEKHNEKGVSITIDQARMIDLKKGFVEKRNLRNTIKVNGTLELFPQNRAEISPLMGGNVKSIYVIEGVDVVKGQLLATMEHPDFIQMQQDLIQKSNMIGYLEKEYQRKEKLFENKVSSAREYQKAKSDYFSSISEIDGMKAKVKMMGLNVAEVIRGKIFETVPITTPIKGSVHLINVNIGEFADPRMGRRQVMFEVTDNSRLHVDLRVFEKDISKIKIGQIVYFTVSNLLGEVLEAKIDAISKAFENNPKSVHVHATIENTNGRLLPGSYVNGRIAISEASMSVISESAILSEEGRSYVFVQVVGDGDVGELTFEKREVFTGIRDLGLIELKNAGDLPDGSELVINGAYTLSSEMVKGELEHKH